MSRIVKQVLAASLALTLLLSGTSLAATTYPTSIALKVNDKTITQGQKVVFKGHLKSQLKKCKKHRTVTLYRNGHAVGAKKTTATGDFKFAKKPSKTRTWQVKFAGRTGGTHPNQYVCKASKSKKIQVKVTG